MALYLEKKSPNETGKKKKSSTSFRRRRILVLRVSDSAGLAPCRSSASYSPHLSLQRGRQTARGRAHPLDVASFAARSCFLTNVPGQISNGVNTPRPNSRADHTPSTTTARCATGSQRSSTTRWDQRVVRSLAMLPRGLIPLDRPAVDSAPPSRSRAGAPVQRLIASQKSAVAHHQTSRQARISRARRPPGAPPRFLACRALAS
jgi:hypothetical protein